MHTQEEKDRQDLKAAHKQQTLHLDPGADISTPSAVWSTVDITRNELVLTFLDAGRLGFDLTLSGVSCIADDAPAAVSSVLRVGMALSAVQGKSVMQLSAEETRRLWTSTVGCRPLALTFAMDMPSSDADATVETSPSWGQEPPLKLQAAEEESQHRNRHDGNQRLRSPTAVTRRKVQETVQSLVGLSKALSMQQEQVLGQAHGHRERPGPEVQLDISAIDTVNASAEALRAAADEIELLQRELRMFQQRAGD